MMDPFSLGALITAGAAAVGYWAGWSHRDRRSKAAEIENQYHHVKRLNNQYRCNCCLHFTLICFAAIAVSVGIRYYGAHRLFNLFYTGSARWKIPLCILVLVLLYAVFTMFRDCSRIISSGNELEQLNKERKSHSDGGTHFSLVNYTNNSTHYTQNICSNTFNFYASVMTILVVFFLVCCVVLFYK